MVYVLNGKTQLGTDLYTSALSTEQKKNGMKSTAPADTKLQNALLSAGHAGQKTQSTKTNHQQEQQIYKTNKTLH